MAQAASYGSAYQTVVPVDVYQDVVADLQETQALARNLEIQNRELWQQNQNLRQEISQFMSAVQQLQKGAGIGTPSVDNATVTVAAPAQRMKTITTKLPEDQTSIRSVADAPDEEAASSGDIDIWNILITIICIIAVGASVGYTAFRTAK